MANKMNDKEMIEEMTNDLPYLTLDRTVFVGATETKNVSWTLSEEDNKLISKELISKGWVKLSEDSVVLSREEYEKYQNLKRDVEYSFEYNQGYTDGQIKGSKETAEKYKGFIRELLTNGDDSITTYYGDVKYRLIREDDLQELAKQFGVEIKE